jgi:hypothetical protein
MREVRSKHLLGRPTLFLDEPRDGNEKPDSGGESDED